MIIQINDDLFDLVFRIYRARFDNILRNCSKNSIIPKLLPSIGKINLNMIYQIILELFGHILTNYIY